MVNVTRTLKIPPVRWEALNARLSTTDRMKLEDQLTHLTVWTARLAAYLGRRQSGGKHADAVKRQNQVARKVRQALGYTYADDKITF